MAILPTRSQPVIVANIAAGIQGRVSSFLNFVVGGVFLAIAEAYGGITLWMQGMLLEVAKLTRLSTSFNSDADSWVADFGIITRIGAVAASGLVVFSRYTASASAPVIPIGAQVKTQDGTQLFQVTADPTNPAYSPTAGGTAAAPIAGYVMPAQVANLAVPVISITNGVSGAPGANGNVAAGAISLIGSQIFGVDTATNPAAFINGSDQESDPAFKLRFQQAIQALSRGTPESIAFAIQSLQTNLQVTVNSNTAPDGTVLAGMTTVFVDDGSGAINSALLAQCQTAAFGYLASGTRMGVYAASQSLLQVALFLTAKPGYSKAVVAAQVSAAIATGINGSGLGAEIDVYTIAAWALAVPGVAKIDNLTVNGGTADLPASISLTYKCSGVLVQ